MTRPLVPGAAGVAPSLARVRGSRIREIAEAALRLDGVLRLEFGESSLPTPAFVKEAAVQALADGYTTYSSNMGLPELRTAIAAHYRLLQGVELDPEREIVVGASGVQSLSLAIRSVLDPDDEAIVLTPVWPNGPENVVLCNATAIEVEHPLAGGRYGLDLETIEAAVTPRTRLLVATSPSNPTGWVATVEEQQALLDLCRRHGLWLLADEVYDRLWYAGGPGEAAPSILRLATRDDAVLVVHSFSKSYCMTGWRVGWLVARADAAATATKLNEFVVSHAASFAQKAAETALRDGEEWVRELVAGLRVNRDLCLRALRSLPGVTVPEPDGAFYLFPRIEGVDDSLGFCKRLLAEEKVALAPGVAFGAGGEGSVRICYAAAPAILEPALERLGRFLERR